MHKLGEFQKREKEGESNDVANREMPQKPCLAT